MEYINLHVSAIDSAEFKGATPAQQGTWICLQRYACGQEQGERIPACRPWPERKWQTVLCVEKNLVLEDCGLWTWEGDDLVITFYPIEQEKRVSKMRRGGRLGNKRRWSDAAKKPAEIPVIKSPPESPPENGAMSPGESVMKWNEMKWNETEGCAPVRVVTLSQAMKFIRSNGDATCTDEQIFLEWLYFDARRGPNGEWLTEKLQVISDWRSALTRALLTRGRMENKKNAPKNLPRERWQVERELETVREQVRTHPKLTWPGNKPLPAEVAAEFEALVARRKALEKELETLA